MMLLSRKPEGPLTAGNGLGTSREQRGGGCSVGFLLVTPPSPSTSSSLAMVPSSPLGRHPNGEEGLGLAKGGGGWHGGGIAGFWRLAEEERPGIDPFVCVCVCGPQRRRPHCVFSIHFALGSSEADRPHLRSGRV